MEETRQAMAWPVGIGIAVAVAWWRRSRPGITIARILIVLIAVYGFAVPLDVLLGGSVDMIRNDECRDVMGVDGVHIVPTAWLFATGLCGTVLGLWLADNRAPNNVPGPRVRFEPFVWCALAVFLVEFWYYYARMGGFASYWSNSRIEALAIAQRTGGSVPYAPALVAAIVALRLDDGQASKFARYATSLVTTATATALALAGSRMEAVLIVLPWIITLESPIGVRSPRMSIFGRARAVLGALLALSVLVWLQHGRAVTTQFLTDGPIATESLTLLDEDDYRPLNIEFGGLYCSHAFYFANPNDSLHLGSTYASAVGWAFPPAAWRMLGRVKPQRIADAEIARWVRNADGYGFSFFLEGYLNFGFVGPPLVGLIVGALAASLDRASASIHRLVSGVASTLVIYVVRANSEVFAITIVSTVVSILPAVLLSVPLRMGMPARR
jgi:hypothetical protein